MEREECANPIMKSSSTSVTKVIRVLIAEDHPVVRYIRLAWLEQVLDSSEWSKPTAMIRS